MAALKQLDDISECPVCMSEYKDPRVLPCCGHTFCLNCIVNSCNASENNPGARIACPQCRETFRMPTGGVKFLPRNLFAVKFLEMKNSRCGACSGVEVATVYCTDCQQKLCPTCEEYHKKFSVTRQHRTENVTGEVSKTGTFWIFICSVYRCTSLL